MPQTHNVASSGEARQSPGADIANCGDQRTASASNRRRKRPRNYRSVPGPQAGLVDGKYYNAMPRHRVVEGLGCLRCVGPAPQVGGAASATVSAVAELIPSSRVALLELLGSGRGDRDVPNEKKRDGVTGYSARGRQKGLDQNPFTTAAPFGFVVALPYEILTDTIASVCRPSIGIASCDARTRGHALARDAGGLTVSRTSQNRNRHRKSDA